METTKSFEHPFRLVEYKSEIDKKSMVHLLELKQISLKDATDKVFNSFLEVEVDKGIGGNIIGNNVVIKYAAQQYRLYCYSDGVLHKGHICSKYMVKNNRFIFVVENDVWCTSKLNCEGIVELGTFYEESLWILQKPKSVTLTGYFDKKLRIRKYVGVEILQESPFTYYVFKKRNGKYDIIMGNHNRVLFYYDEVEEDEIVTLRKDVRSGLNREYYTDHSSAKEKILGGE